MIVITSPASDAGTDDHADPTMSATWSCRPTTHRKIYLPDMRSSIASKIRRTTPTPASGLTRGRSAPADPRYPAGLQERCRQRHWRTSQDRHDADHPVDHHVDCSGHVEGARRLRPGRVGRLMAWVAASAAIRGAVSTPSASLGAIVPFFLSISLIIKHTAEVHDQVADLLRQLRRLQDLQVSVEVRFITVNDTFFEFIGVDFDFQIQSDTVGKHSTFADPESRRLSIFDSHERQLRPPRRARPAPRARSTSGSSSSSTSSGGSSGGSSVSRQEVAGRRAAPRRPAGSSVRRGVAAASER